MHTLGLQGNPSTCCPRAHRAQLWPHSGVPPSGDCRCLCPRACVSVCVYLCLCPLYACVYLLTGQSEATAHALLHLAYCWGHREVSVLENEPHRTSDSEPLPPAPARPHGWNIGAHNSDPQPDSPTCLSLAPLGPGEGSRGHREEL